MTILFGESRDKLKNPRAVNFALLCISLPEAIQRRRSVAQLVSRLPNSTPVDFVYAVRGSDERQRLSVLATSLQQAPPACDRGVVEFLSAEYFAVLGCSLSHLKAIREASVRSVDWALIFEDDIVPDILPYWSDGLIEYVQMLPSDWAVVQLSLIGNEPMWLQLINRWEVSERPMVMPSTEFWSTGAYLISRTTIDTVVKTYDAGDGKFDLQRLSCLNADIHLLKDVAPRGTYYVATPPLFTCAEEGISYIHGDQPGRMKVHEFSRKMSLDWSSSAARSNSFNFSSVSYRTR